MIRIFKGLNLISKLLIKNSQLFLKEVDSQQFPHILNGKFVSEAYDKFCP